MIQWRYAVGRKFRFPHGAGRKATEMEDIYRTLTDIRAQGKQAALAIVVRTKGSAPRKAGAKMIVMGDGSILGTLGGGGLEKKVIEESLEVMKGDKAKLTSFPLEESLDMMCGGEVDVYIEPINQPEQLIIFGAGHITKALAPLMRSLDFRVTVVDDTPKRAEEEGFADIEVLLSEDMESYAEKLSPESTAYIVILTRSFSKDKAVLERLIGKDFRYVGMVGSKKKIRTIKEDLTSKGIEGEHFSKLSAPIGLGIGAETPGEIALSIAAEIVSVKRGKAARSRNSA
jgi:xanthine dehydrogenase accessory factor